MSDILGLSFRRRVVSLFWEQDLGPRPSCIGRSKLRFPLGFQNDNLGLYSDFTRILLGFELDVIDYLLKPISLERFLKATTKAKDFFELRNKNSTKSDYFFVKCSNKFEKIFYNELLYAEAANN